jgi:hypothetical protein
VVLAKRATAYGLVKEDVEAAATHIREAIVYSMRADDLICDHPGERSAAYADVDGINANIPVYLSSRVLASDTSSTFYASPSAAYSANYGRPVVIFEPGTMARGGGLDGGTDSFFPTTKNSNFGPVEGSVLSGFVADALDQEEQEERDGDHGKELASSVSESDDQGDTVEQEPMLRNDDSNNISPQLQE